MKTLILEFVAGQGAGHIKEIHLAVAEMRPEVPQHTVRARLSEMAGTDDLEERLKAFGNGFYGLYYEENRAFCSVVSYPERGPWGSPCYRGNCSGHLVKDLILRFQAKSVFDPAEGGGTVRDVVEGINRFKQQGIRYEGRDIQTGWDVLSSPLPSGEFDLVWFHPPYWDIIRYSESAGDMSMARSLEEFEAMLNLACERLAGVLRQGGVLAVLIGDKRKNGEYYPLMRSLLMGNKLGRLRAILIKEQHNCRSDSVRYCRGNPFFIPIRHEYCLLFEKAH